MKVTRGTILCLVILMMTVPASAQDVQTPSGQKTLAATMSVYVFPTEGQAAELQSQDEAGCYTWAVQSVGTDPFALQKQAQRQQQQTAQQKEQAKSVGQGAGAVGAVRGAAAGALIGGISGDAGKGAAYGAAAGLVRGRRRGRAANSQAQAQVEQQAQTAQVSTEAQVLNFKKAFAVCLEAKKYMVKF